jgi:hypothetical protein
MYEGMRIAKQELNELALNGDRLIFEVRRGERVVCQRVGTRRQYGGGKRSNQPRALPVISRKALG